MVAPNQPVSGMMLFAVPAWISVTDTTTSSSGLTLRLAMVWSAPTMPTIAGIGSIQAWG